MPSGAIMDDRMADDLQAVIAELGGEKVLGRALRTDNDLRSAIREGFPQKVVGSVMNSAGLTLKELSATLDLSPRSLQRRRHEGRLAPYESDRAKLRHDHLRQQTRACGAFLNGLRRLACRLYRAGAGVLFADIFDYDQLRRNVLIALAGLFAELAQLLRTEGAVLFRFLKIVHDTFAFQMARQCAAAT